MILHYIKFFLLHLQCFFVLTFVQLTLLIEIWLFRRANLSIAAKVSLHHSNFSSPFQHSIFFSISSNVLSSSKLSFSLACDISSCSSNRMHSMFRFSNSAAFINEPRSQYIFRRIFFGFFGVSSSYKIELQSNMSFWNWSCTVTAFSLSSINFYRPSITFL